MASGRTLLRKALPARTKAIISPILNVVCDRILVLRPDRGLEPLDAEMEAALPQRRQGQRKHSSGGGGHPRRPDPPTAAPPARSSNATPHPYRQRNRRRRQNESGYENSGHETSDFIVTEDDKSDFYLVTEDDRDDDDKAEDAGGGAIKGSGNADDDDDGSMGLLVSATNKMSLLEPDLSDHAPNADSEGDKKVAKNLKGADVSPTPATNEKPSPQQSQVNDDSSKQPVQATPSKATPPRSSPPPASESESSSTAAPAMAHQGKPKKKRTPRKRTPRAKKSNATPATPQSTAMIPEDCDVPKSMQEEEELDCHTPMRTTLHAQQMQQTPKKARGKQQQHRKSPNEQRQEKLELNDVQEKEMHDPHEDEDDYPPDIMATAITPAKCGESEDKRQQEHQRQAKSTTAAGGGPESEANENSKGEDDAQHQEHQQQKKQKQRTIEEELTFLKRTSCTTCQVQVGASIHVSSRANCKQCHVSFTHPQQRSHPSLCRVFRSFRTRHGHSPGFVPNMKVPAEIIVNDDLQALLVQELEDSCCGPKSAGAFVPALRQAANVAALPGIVRASLAMPDVHSGYGFCIGNVAAFDMDDPEAVISPGGVGFDINCGVRLVRTNLTEEDVGESVREELAEAMFRNIPVGVGAGGKIPCSMEELDKLLSDGINWAIEKGVSDEWHLV